MESGNKEKDETKEGSGVEEAAGWEPQVIHNNSYNMQYTLFLFGLSCRSWKLLFRIDCSYPALIREAYKLYVFGRFMLFS